MKPTVIILRGLPGSGKSSVARFLEPCGYVSMDLFWTNDGEPYRFDYDRMEEAIEWTRRVFVDHLDAKFPLSETAIGMPVNSPRFDTVVVDNVNYARRHYQFFLDEAAKRGCRVHILHVERALGDLSNTHGVSHEHVAKQADKWEKHR